MRDGYHSGMKFTVKFMPSVMNAIAAFCLIALLFMLPACERSASGEPTHVLQFKVVGLHCDGCAGSVRNEVARLKGVRSCRVSYEEGLATVEVDDPSLAQAIIERIESLDFTATLLDGTEPPGTPGTPTEDHDDAAPAEDDASESPDAPGRV